MAGNALFDLKNLSSFFIKNVRIYQSKPLIISTDWCPAHLVTCLVIKSDHNLFVSHINIMILTKHKNWIYFELSKFSMPNRAKVKLEGEGA